MVVGGGLMVVGGEGIKEVENYNFLPKQWGVILNNPFSKSDSIFGEMF